MSERSIGIVREYHFDPKEVIKGLNGYYESDKRNDYITIRRNDVEGPAYLSTPIYLSALIEWLRVDHDIFYRPCLTLEMRCVVREKESAIEKLKNRITELESNFKAVCDEDDIFRARALKDRSFTILQDLYRDIFKKQPDGLSAEGIANKILDRVLETEDLLHKSVDSVNKECKATGKLMVDNYKLKLKSYILKDIKEHGYRYDGLETKSVEEIVDWIITMATCPRDEWAKDEIENLRSQITRLKDLINAMNEEVGDM